MSNITNILKQAIDKLLVISESEYPFKVVTWNCTTLDKITLLKKTGYSKNTPIEVVKIDSFFKNFVSSEDWYDDEEKANVKKFQNLVNVLKTNLTNIQVYKIISKEIQVYIVGNTPNGIAGVSTTLVKT